jgi:PII-like signaling protein
MENYQSAKLLRLHFTELDRYESQPLYEAIVEKCKELKIAGATVFRGLEGYGETAEIHRPRLLSHDLPVVVQIVDSESNIQRLLTVVENMLEHGMIAISDVSIRRIQNKLSL